MKSFKIECMYKKFDKTKILNGVFLEIQPKTINGIIGRNGCGKSTFLNSLMGYYSDSEESVFINSNYISKKKRCKNIGYLPQISFLPKDETVKSILKTFVSIDKFNQIISIERVDKLKHERTKNLSVGERRFIEFCLTINQNKDIFLLDEPFTGIEPIFHKLIFDILKKKVETGSSILIVEHNMHIIKNVCDNLFYMQSGILVPIGKDDLKKIGFEKRPVFQNN